jgi:predicted ATPase/Flp pilus assembly protein TadD
MERLGRYELHELLGEGGVGRVFRGALTGPGGFRRPVAVKLLADGEALQREARLGGLLRHRHLVDVYEVGEVDGAWFCAMELCGGGALSRYLPLPAAAVVEVGLQVCEALQYAHEALGLVHLDIKPDNLLLAGDQVKVADLGIARARGFRGDGRTRGTPGFMAPEQSAGGVVDARTDIYALGVTLVVLATGRLPGATASPGGSSQQTWSLDAPPGASATLDWTTLEGAPPGAGAEGAAALHDPGGVPGWLAPAALPCLQPSPERRWQDMAALAEALRALRPGGPGLRTAIGWSPPHVQRPEGTLADHGDAFVGREAELAELAERLAAPGVVTLRGPAGVGKSRLAAEAARRWRGGPAWSCDLSQTRGLDGLLFAVSSALDVAAGQGSGQELVDRLGSALAGRGPAVLVLDNADPVAALADAASRWRVLAPEARLVITSRQALGLSGEQVLSLAPLSAADARALVVARAHQRGAEIAADPDLDALCERLEGLPLALELAAGRLGVLGVADVLERLDLSLLCSGGGGRHGTLQAALDWSWELLGDEERSALTQLSVFSGGFTLEAAEAVVALPDHGGRWIADLVQALVDHSLVRSLGERDRAGRGRAEPRFALFSAVQQYAARRLLEPAGAGPRQGWSGGAPARAARLRHRSFFAGFGAPEAIEALYGPGGAARWWALREELDNLCAASEATGPGEVEQAAQLAVALAHVLRRQGPVSAAAGYLRAARALVGAPTSPARLAVASDLERLLGDVCRVSGQVAEAGEHYRAALALARAGGGALAEGRALGQLGSLYLIQGKLEPASERYRAALALLRAAGDRRSEAYVQMNLGAARSELGDNEEARVRYEVALALQKATGDRQGEGQTLMSLGILYGQQGRHGMAGVYFGGCLVIARELGDRYTEALALNNIAVGQKVQGRLEGAMARLEDALAIQRELGFRRNEALSLLNLGNLYEQLGQREVARERLEASLAISRAVQDPYGAAGALRSLSLLDEEEGQLERARQRLEEVLVIHRGVGNPREEGHTLSALASVLRVLGELEEAGRQLELAEGLLAAAGDIEGICRIACGRGLLRLAGGDLAGAGEALARGLELAAELGATPGGELMAALEALEAAIARGG